MLSKTNYLNIYLITGLLFAQITETHNKLATNVIGALGIASFCLGIGYWLNGKVAENQNNSIIVDVATIDPEINFQEFFSLFEQARANNKDPVMVIANAFAENSKFFDVSKFNEYVATTLYKYQRLESHATLWKNKNHDLYKEANEYIDGEKGNKLQNKLRNLQKLASDLNQLETYFHAYAYFKGIENKSFNHDGAHFPLIRAVKEMQKTCEELASYKRKLNAAMRKSTEYSNYYKDLILQIEEYNKNLEQSIVNIRNMTAYEDQLKNHELREERDKLIKIQEQNTENERQRVENIKLEHMNYKRRMEKAEKRNEELCEEKNNCLEKLEQEKKKNKKLEEELKKLKLRAEAVEKELEMLKKIEAAESKMIEELNKKEVELKLLREKIQEIQFKINNGNLPVNPFSEDGTKFLLNFIMNL